MYKQYKFKNWLIEITSKTIIKKTYREKAMMRDEHTPHFLAVLFIKRIYIAITFINIFSLVSFSHKFSTDCRVTQICLQEHKVKGKNINEQMLQQPQQLKDKKMPAVPSPASTIMPKKFYLREHINQTKMY